MEGWRDRGVERWRDGETEGYRDGGEERQRGRDIFPPKWFCISK